MHPKSKQDAIVQQMLAEIQAVIQDDSHVPALPQAEGDLGKLSRAIGDLTQLLESRFDQLHRLMQLTEKINAGLVIDEVLDQLFTSFRDVLPYDRIGVALLEEDGLQVRSRWARSLATSMRLQVGFAAPLAGSSLQTVLETGCPRILNDLEAYLVAHPGSFATRLVVAEGVRSSLTCPLTAMGKKVGFIFFSSFHKDTYRDVHAELFVAIAGQLTNTIEKGRIYEMVLQSKRESERLLLNILPAAVAARLKAGATQIADRYPSATIGFADIVGFTEIAAGMPAEMVVGLLNRVYSAFDAVCEFHGAEKIKTVGDAYMFAAGLPTPRMDHLEVAMQVAMDMVGVLEQIPTRQGGRLQVRIGIASGPVIAGVIGTSKFAYDVWGDTVNQASRMESEGVAGRIQVTEAIREILRTRLTFEDRGCIEMKGLGATRVYLVASDADALLSSAVPSVVAASRERRGVTRSLYPVAVAEDAAKPDAVSARTGGPDSREVAIAGTSDRGPGSTRRLVRAHTDS